MRLRIRLILSLSIVIFEAIVVLVEVRNLEPVDLLSLEGVVLGDRVHILENALGPLVLGCVAGVVLELREHFLLRARA